MFCLRHPTHATIRDYLARQNGQPYSYDALGPTCGGATSRPGWDTDHHRVLLGHGEAVFQKASQAIDTWQMFPREITTVFGHQAPRENLTVAVLYRANPLPLYLLMPARIVYLIDDSQPRDEQHIQRHGFAYGTLPDHPERGEERFLIEWNKSDDTVHYDLLAISQPSHWLVRLGYPYTRLQQARFRRLSGLAMQRAVTASSE